MTVIVTANQIVRAYKEELGGGSRPVEVVQCDRENGGFAAYPIRNSKDIHSKEYWVLSENEYLVFRLSNGRLSDLIAENFVALD